MPPKTADNKQIRRKRSEKAGIGRIFAWIILIVLSPALLLLDALRSEQSHRHTIYAFMLFSSVVVAFTGIAILMTETPTNRLLQVLNGQMATGDTEIFYSSELAVIHGMALKYRLDPQLIMAVIKAESNFRPRAVSPKGARGLMQIMPLTWRHYNPESRCLGNHAGDHLCHEGDCIFSVERNIETGVRYLKDLVNKYDGRVDLALQAYNAGQSNVDQDGLPKYKETRNFLQRVTGYWAEFRRDHMAGELQLVMGLRRHLHLLFLACSILWMILFIWVFQRVIRAD